MNRLSYDTYHGMLKSMSKGAFKFEECPYRKNGHHKYCHNYGTVYITCDKFTSLDAKSVDYTKGVYLQCPIPTCTQGWCGMCKSKRFVYYQNSCTNCNGTLKDCREGCRGYCIYISPPPYPDAFD